MIDIKSEVEQFPIKIKIPDTKIKTQETTNSIKTIVESHQTTASSLLVKGSNPLPTEIEVLRIETIFFFLEINTTI